MANIHKHYVIVVDEEIADAFIEMSKLRGEIRRSPRSKETLVKEDSSYIPSEEDEVSIEEIT